VLLYFGEDHWLLKLVLCVCLCTFIVRHVRHSVCVKHVDAESRLESERSSRQKAEKELLETKKLISSLEVDVSQYKQQADTVVQELAAETEKVCSDDYDAVIYL